MNEKTHQLRLGIPKGSLQETTQRLFVRAGYDLRISGRSYYPEIDDPEIQCILIRPQEMAHYVAQGILDCAITGLDWVMETGADVVEMADLRAPWPNYGVVRWVLASKEDSAFHEVKDLEGRRIATEAVGLTRRFLAQHGVSANVEFSWGATEVKPPLLADAIVEVTETGSSLRANKLKILDTVMESNTVLIANRSAWQDAWKRQKLENIKLLLEGAMLAFGKVGLMLNVHKDSLAAVLKVLPALKRPTISELSESGWVAVNTILDEKLVRVIIPQLKQAGAQGIVEYPLNKIIM